MRVLIIRLSAMGDIIHGLPAAALLKQKLPDLELSWLVEPAGIPLLAGNPIVDRVIVFPKRKWLKQLRSVSGLGATAAEATAFLSQLKSPRFDAAIDFQGLFKSSLLGFLSSANLRFGFKGTREGADRMLTHCLDVGNYFGFENHVVDLNLRLADFASRVLLGEPSDTAKAQSSSYIYDAVRFPLPAPSAEAKAKLRKLLHQDAGTNSGPLVAFIPGTTWETKIWEPDKWAALGKMCLDSFGGRLLLLGGPAETHMNQRIAAQLDDRVINLTGDTEILDLIAIFEESDIVIGADTGPLHLAAAVGKPKILAIFGSTPAGRNGPYGPQCSTVSLNLECQPCFKKICPLGTLACLKELSPEGVFKNISL